MQLLLDTQILVWLVNGDKRLRQDWISLIEDHDTGLHVSSVIAFEYTDLQLDPLPAGAWQRIVQLPDIHRDPVDRMLVAHALEYGASMMTADANIRRYPALCV